MINLNDSLALKTRLDLSESSLDEGLDDEEDSQLMLLLMPVIIVSGVIGNLLNLIIFGRRSMRKSSTFRFLFYLSAFDILVLLVGALDAYLNFGFQIEIRKYSSFVCRLHTFGTYLLAHSSSTILMLISIDRALVMSNKRMSFLFRKNLSKKDTKNSVLNSTLIKKTKRKKLSSTAEIKNSRNSLYNSTVKLHRIDTVIFLALIFLILLNVHYLFFLELNLHEVSDDEHLKQTPSNNASFLFKSNNSNNSSSVDYELICFPRKNEPYRIFLEKVYIWIDILVYSLIPFLIMSICSVIILFRIRKSTQKYFSSLLYKRNEFNKSNFYRRLKRNRQLLYMLLITNLYFFLSSLPYCITFLMYRGSLTNDNNRLQISVHTLSYTNNAINFIFYGLSSQKYREELKSLVCGKVNKRKASKRSENEAKASAAIFNHQSHFNINSKNINNATNNTSEKIGKWDFPKDCSVDAQIKLLPVYIDGQRVQII